MKNNQSNRRTVIWLLAVAALLAAMFTLSLFASKAGYANLLLVTPTTFGVQGLNTEKLDEISEEEFLLTYSIRQPASVQAVNSNHSAVLVGTNHCFSDVMGYVFSSGGFFTESAAETKQKHAALNETAAYSIFGGSNITGSTLKINGETWIVTGVILDNDEENANIYVPATLTGGRADSVMVLTGASVTESYAKNRLKDAGVRDTDYDFIKLSKSAGVFYERFSVAWKSALLAIFMLLILTSGGKILKQLRFYKDKMRELYFTELVIRYRKDFLKAVAGFVLFAAGIALMLMLSLQILETCLTWQELIPVTDGLASGDFGHKLLWLKNYQVFGEVLFWLSICLVVSGLIPVLSGRRAGRTGHPANYRIL